MPNQSPSYQMPNQSPSDQSPYYQMQQTQLCGSLVVAVGLEPKLVLVLELEMVSVAMGRWLWLRQELHRQELHRQELHPWEVVDQEEALALLQLLLLWMLWALASTLVQEFVQPWTSTAQAHMEEGMLPSGVSLAKTSLPTLVLEDSLEEQL